MVSDPSPAPQPVSLVILFPATPLHRRCSCCGVPGHCTYREAKETTYGYQWKQRWYRDKCGERWERAGAAEIRDIGAPPEELAWEDAYERLLKPGASVSGVARELGISFFVASRLLRDPNMPEEARAFVAGLAEAKKAIVWRYEGLKVLEERKTLTSRQYLEAHPRAQTVSNAGKALHSAFRAHPDRIGRQLIRVGDPPNRWAWEYFLLEGNDVDPG